MASNAWNAIKSFAASVSRKVKSIFKPQPEPVQPAGSPTPTGPTLDVQAVANPLFSGTETTPGNVYTRGAWTLYIYYRNRATRSQGQHGVLYKDGLEVQPKQVGEIIQTELGDLKYNMRPEEMTLLWDMTGWTFVG